MKPLKKILIVDDEPLGREILSDMLLGQPYRCLFAEDGQAAIAQTRAVEPDLILLDVMMPDMNGFEVCQILKSDPKYQHIPIILVTALDGDNSMVKGIDAGADDFLHKPIKRVELEVRVRSLLRIKQQYDVLSQTLRLREDMADMIVHDIRNPLTIIYSTSQLIRARARTDEDRQDAERLIKQVRRLEDFMNDMLLMAKMETGQLVINQTETDVHSLIRDVSNSYAEVAHQRKIRIVSEVPHEPYPVTLDATLFERVLDNLVINALRYSPANTTVTLQAKPLPAFNPEAKMTTRSEQSNPRVRVKIIDQGRGIPLEWRDRVFHKYGVISVRNTQTRQVGLGLPFCKMVVDAHGGDISIADNTPEGTVFTVDI
ncbi:MAG: response regulator [Chloroflexota bacterium]